MASRLVTLGIDLGTTSVKAALLEAAPGHPSGFVVLASCARAARAETESAVAGPQVSQRPGAAAPRRPWGHLGQHLSAKKSPRLPSLSDLQGLLPFPSGPQSLLQLKLSR